MRVIINSTKWSQPGLYKVESLLYQETGFGFFAGG